MPINNNKYILRIKRKVREWVGKPLVSNLTKKNCGPAINAIVEYARKFKFDSFDMLLFFKCDPRVFKGEKFIKLTSCYGNISTTK